MSTAAQPKYLRHVDAEYEELTDLFAAGEAVALLLSHPGFAAVERIVERELAAVDRQLDDAPAPLSQAEYAMAHGRRGAMRAFGEAATAIVARADRRREEQVKKHEGDGETSPGR